MLTVVLGHAARPLEPHDLWSAWNLDPLLIGGLVLAAWAYRRGRARRRRVGRHRPGDRWRDRCFAAALAALGVALVSPLDAMAGSLASAHMVQHVLLVLAAAPLLALSAPLAALVRGSPSVVRSALQRGRRAPGRLHLVAWLRDPVALWLAHVVALWFWHAAVPYDAALRHHVLHVLEHATFLVTGVLFWGVVLGPRRAVRAAPGFGVLAVFTMALQGVFLAALLTFARSPWYATYRTTTAAWGLDPLADQQLAGAIMWIPAGLVYVGAGLALLVTWLRSTEAEAAAAADAARHPSGASAAAEGPAAPEGPARKRAGRPRAAVDVGVPRPR